VSVAAFLAELRSRDVRVWSDGDELRCNAPAGVLTAALRDRLREQKGDIVRFLRSAEDAARQPRAIVPLQPRGSRVPIFAVGGHNGDVFCYRALAQCLGDDQPFFGLRPPGLDGECAPLTSVQDLAAHFAAQIRAFRPSGPAIIAGYCAGGAIAFEAGQQLLQRGGHVEFVALFAGRYPTWFRLLSQLCHRGVHYADRIGTHAQALMSRSVGEQRRYVGDMWRRRQVRANQGRSESTDPAVTLVQRVQLATMAGIRAYTPDPFPGRLCLFLPSAKARRSVDGLLRWRAFAEDVREYSGPDGCEGDSMLLEPHVFAIARLFRCCTEA
jgi:thioesterase domain-containing protein